MYDTAHYGRMIRERRKKAHLTIEEAAERYDITYQNLQTRFFYKM